jgi:hypothetical protein
MKQSLKDFLFNLAISMLIGLLVGMIQLTLISISRETIKELIRFSIIGGVIGTISRLAFLYVFEIKQKSGKMAFISVFIVIGTISSIPNFYYYLVYNVNISAVELALILITAELLGMSFCYYSHKRYLALNSKLMNKKRQLIRKD